MTRIFTAFLLIAISVASVGCGQSGDSGDSAADSATSTISYAPIPESIRTPDNVRTRLGTLEFFDGYPSAETVETVYDNLDFQRGVTSVLGCITDRLAVCNAGGV